MFMVERDVTDGEAVAEIDDAADGYADLLCNFVDPGIEIGHAWLPFVSPERIISFRLLVAGPAWPWSHP